MELAQLRYVVAVADTSNFTRAAEKCFVTQSALSHQIAALERELGQRLFARSSRRVQATEAGEAFIRHARLALLSVENARDEAAAAAGEVRGTLRLGVIPTVTAVSVPLLLRDFRAAHPQTRVEMRMGNSDALIPAVRAGEIDVALVGLREGAEPPGVSFRALTKERLVAALPAGHLLASRDAITLADLSGEVFADFPAGTSGRAQSDTAFAAAGITRDVAFEADTADLLLGLVAAEMGVSLLARGVVQDARAGVVAVPVSDGPVRVEYIVWDERIPRGVTRAFVELLNDAVRRGQRPS